MQTTMTAPAITDTDRKRRRRYRTILKEAVKEASGLRATLLCMAISHARRTTHCRTYALYHGGWRKRQEALKKLGALRADETFSWDRYDVYMRRFDDNLTDAERLNFGAAVIQNLEDQADFLTEHLDADDTRAVRCAENRENGRPIYEFMRPRLEPELRTIIRYILDTVPLSQQ